MTPEHKELIAAARIVVDLTANIHSSDSANGTIKTSAPKLTVALIALKALLPLEIPPCPMCGSEDIRFTGDFNDLIYVTCDFCGARSGMRDTEEDAIAAWRVGSRW